MSSNKESYNSEDIFENGVVGLAHIAKKDQEIAGRLASERVYCEALVWPYTGNPELQARMWRALEGSLELSRKLSAQEADLYARRVTAEARRQSSQHRPLLERVMRGVVSLFHR